MFGKKKIKAIEKHLEKFKICHHCKGLFLKSSMKKIAFCSTNCFDEPMLFFCNQHTPNYDEVKFEYDCEARQEIILYSKKKTKKQVKRPNYKV